ncbi:hypothetical protein ES332_A11G307200v1 [Gossypium tomentosum]|uniref:Uncharacterized protein n=1 Tax=Gossypium tomentosum TaxID=34277 RepID=A0A5D2NHA8_GOSTO|nr:hypothetical protein ES332_A11G307200v1 [Gossypium tomentosum]
MQATNHEIRIFLLSAIYLSSYSLFPIYQAYTHGDFSMVAFTVFVYIGSFCLIYCIKQLQDSPPMDTSLRKRFLKSVIWFLISVISFGFAYRFSTFAHPVAAVFVFALAVSSSSFLFFFYFVRPNCKSGTLTTELYPTSQVENA